MLAKNTTSALPPKLPHPHPHPHHHPRPFVKQDKWTGADALTFPRTSVVHRGSARTAINHSIIFSPNWLDVGESKRRDEWLQGGPMKTVRCNGWLGAESTFDSKNNGPPSPPERMS